MEKSERALQRLKAAVEAGASKHKDISSKDLVRYVDNVVREPLQEVLSDFRNQVKERHKIESEQVKERYKIESEESDNEQRVKVIHYTSIDAVVSMLQNEAEERKKNSTGKDNGTYLRLYDSFHLNDPDEGNYIVRDLLEEYDWLKRKDLPRLPHAYITSFIHPDSKDGTAEDNLVFWRTYGKEGEGCSLSLYVPRNQLKKVLYGKEERKCTIEILRPILESLEPLVEVAKEHDYKDTLGALPEIVWKSLEEFRYLYKSKAYKYENECRFVVCKSECEEENICFESYVRNNSSTVVRHYCVHEDLEIKKLMGSGSKITIGPSVVNPYNMSYYLKTLKRKAKLDGPEIRISRISYRKS